MVTGFVNEPLTDFSVEANRNRQLEALKQVRSEFGRHYPLIIDGGKVDTKDRLQSLNPSRPKEIVGTLAHASVKEAEMALNAALRAAPAWSQTPAKKRAEYLLRAAEVMCRRRLELNAWVIYEEGKAWREADADLAEAIDFLRYYALEMIRLDEHPHVRNVPGEDNIYVYEPRGVCVVIAPWNFPMAILTGMTVAAIVTGNTVIVKPSQQSAVVAAKLFEIFEEIGLPAGVANFCQGPGSQVGKFLVEHPRVNQICFTGSREVGCYIYSAAAHVRPEQVHLKKVIAEMGGKNGLIIDEDADLDEAVAGTAYSAFGYSGQKCSACSRAIVLERVYDKFLDRLVEASKSLTVGPADDPAVIVGPVIDNNAFESIHRYIDKGRSEGRTLLETDVSRLREQTGGGYYIGPTIFADVSPTATIAQEEIFGPVLAVMRAKDFDHALQIANGTDYALTGGVYSRSPANLELARRAFRVGNLYLNRKITGALVDRQPFGGSKMSGIGSKAGGPDYLLQFVEPKTITENTLRHGFAPEEASE